MSLIIDADGEYLSATGLSLSPDGQTGATVFCWLKRVSATNDLDFSVMVSDNIVYGSAEEVLVIGHRNGIIDNRTKTTNSETRESDTLTGSGSTAWQIAALVFEGSGVPFTSYVAPVGGSVSSRASAANTTSTLGAITAVKIGGAIADAARIRIAHFAYWDTKLTSTQITELFSGGTGGGKNPTAVASGNLKAYAALDGDATVHTGGFSLSATGTLTYDSGDNPPVDAVGGGGGSFKAAWVPVQSSIIGSR